MGQAKAGLSFVRFAGKNQFTRLIYPPVPIRAGSGRVVNQVGNC